METKIYIVLSALYFVLGIISVCNFTFKDFGLKSFILLTVLLPITKFTTNFHIIFQVSIYYYFFIGVCIIFLLKAAKNNINKKVLQGTTIVFSMLFFYCIHFLLFVDKNSVEAINVLKDIKPFILIILAYFFIEHYKERLSKILTRKFCNWVLILNFIVCSVFFYLMVRYQIHLSLTDDPYYKFEETRLETLGAYFGLFYLLFLILNRIKPKIKEVVFSIIPLLYTGNRTLIFAALLVVVIYFLLRASIKRIILFFSMVTVFLSGLIYMVLRAAEESPLFRFKKLLEPEYIEYALLNRFSPFIDAAKSFNFSEFIVGKGLGFAFFIPWFEWRENIKNFNIYIDNLYLTLYAKFGVFSILFFFILFMFLNNYLKSKTALFYFIFILFISITNAFIYQYNFLWILLMFVIPFNPLLSKQK